MSTIKDVAKRAGVAISTASAVINRSAPVSEEVIAKVEAAIRDIGYVPHGGARNLRMGRSRLIGLIVPNITNPHFAKVARVVESACLNAGYMAAVYSTSDDPAREQQILAMMQMQRVEGLIIIPTLSDAEHGRRMADMIQVPTIQLDSSIEALPYDVVELDNIAAARLATEHLIGLGHRRIAVIVGRRNVVTGRDRLQGYCLALADHGLAVEPDLLLESGFEQARAHASVLARMGEPAPPTAVFAPSNMTMLGTLYALRDLGLRVPRDISVIGIDDFDFATIMDPPPTVVAAPVIDMAQAAIDSLLGMIARKSAPTGSRTVFAPTLVVRSSCRRLEPPRRPPKAG